MYAYTATGITDHKNSRYTQFIGMLLRPSVDSLHEAVRRLGSGTSIDLDGDDTSNATATATVTANNNNVDAADEISSATVNSIASSAVFGANTTNDEGGGGGKIDR